MGIVRVMSASINIMILLSQDGKRVRVYTGKPYVKKLMLKVRKTAPVNKTFVCLMPDLQVINNSVSCTEHTKVRIKLID